jgi:hypothetical protein
LTLKSVTKRHEIITGLSLTRSKTRGTFALLLIRQARRQIK